jgi:hypothetical protein
MDRTEVVKCKILQCGSESYIILEDEGEYFKAQSVVTDAHQAHITTCYYLSNKMVESTHQKHALCKARWDILISSGHIAHRQGKVTRQKLDTYLTTLYAVVTQLERS